MWKKYFIIVILFYLSTLLQNSFFIHFNLFGVSPNLVFILFFLLIFFSVGARHRWYPGWEEIFFAVTAGILLDIFFHAYLGMSVVLLIIVAFLLKNTQLLLKSRKDRFPFIYFAPLFIIFLLVYNFLFDLLSYFLYQSRITTIFATITIFVIIYNLFIASVFFYIYKIFLALRRGKLLGGNGKKL